MSDAEDAIRLSQEEFERDKIETTREREAQFCEHMKAFVSHCREVGVFFGGCGECGSPWLTCKACRKEVDDAADVFTDEEKQL